MKPENVFVGLKTFFFRLMTSEQNFLLEGLAFLESEFCEWFRAGKIIINEKTRAILI
jgi:hypothetical protein